MNPHNPATAHPRWLCHEPPLETAWVQWPTGCSGTLQRHRKTQRAERIPGSCGDTHPFQIGPADHTPTTRTHPIPIALRATPATGARPAVSSLEACPTPAP
jgi:hypothetical protein